MERPFSLLMVRTAPGLLLAVLLLPSLAAQAQTTRAAAAVLRDALAAHDPQGLWERGVHTLALRETRPSGAERLTQLTFDRTNTTFAMRQERDEGVVEASWSPTTCSATLDGASMDAETADRLRLHCEGPRTVGFWRDYYGYLYTLPMNLVDAGTQLDPVARLDTLRGRSVWALRATYAAEIGEDTWYLYIDPDTYTLVGSRFYHDETANDGEVLYYEGAVEAAG
ncbi:MAG: DUF6503 family protein, partial [Bacteroidota bacterium]